jgi:hypothetical protein
LPRQNRPGPSNRGSRIAASGPAMPQCGTTVKRETGGRAIPRYAKAQCVRLIPTVILDDRWYYMFEL